MRKIHAYAPDGVSIVSIDTDDVMDHLNDPDWESYFCLAQAPREPKDTLICYLPKDHEYRWHVDTDLRMIRRSWPVEDPWEKHITTRVRKIREDWAVSTENGQHCDPDLRLSLATAIRGLPDNSWPLERIAWALIDREYPGKEIVHAFYEDVDIVAAQLSGDPDLKDYIFDIEPEELMRHTYLITRWDVEHGW